MEELLKYIQEKQQPFDEFFTVSVLQLVKPHIQQIFQLDNLSQTSYLPDYLM
jgi:hypothetical protein